MQYRKFGVEDWNASVLGFGCARLPTTENGDVDDAKAVEMVRYAIDHGVNYLDTSYVYHGGDSERLLAQALQDGYQSRVRVATKLPCWMVKDPGDFDRYLDEQLERLGTEYVDYYLLHRLNTNERTWPGMRDLCVFEWAEAAIADGRIGALGFSSHDNYDVFVDIVDAYDRWAVCQIQYNYMDVDKNPGIEGLRYAAARGLPIVIMEPLLGGGLADPPPEIRRIFAAASRGRTPADWGMHWLWNQPEVTVVLSGMSTMDHVRENVASADATSAGILDESDLAVIDRVHEAFLGYRAIPCTECRYCMPCPGGVDIPLVFSTYNRGMMFDDLGFMRDAVYNSYVREDARADACTGCQACEDKCSQQIAVSEWMPIVHGVLGEGQPYPT